MSAWGLEARVGAFVLGALALLLLFVFALGDLSFGRRTAVYADFGFTGGLQVGAPVKVSGIKIGRVAGIELLAKSQGPAPAAALPELGRSSPAVVRARLDLEPTFAESLGKDSRMQIATQGVIGEAYVEVDPKGAPPLADAQVVRGVDAPRLHDMILQMANLLGTMAQMLGGESDQDLGPLGAALAQLVGNVNGIVAGRQAELSAALGDLAAAAHDVKDVTSGVRRAVGDGTRLEALVDGTTRSVDVLSRELPGLLQRASSSAATLDALHKKLDGTIDPKEVDGILADVAATTADLKDTVAQTRSMVARIERGDGTVGGLLKDSQIYDDVKEMLRDLKRNPWKFMWRD